MATIFDLNRKRGFPLKGFGCIIFCVYHHCTHFSWETFVHNFVQPKLSIAWTIWSVYGQGRLKGPVNIYRVAGPGVLSISVKKKFFPFVANYKKCTPFPPPQKVVDINNIYLRLLFSYINNIIRDFKWQILWFILIFKKQNLDQCWLRIDSLLSVTQTGSSWSTDVNKTAADNNKNNWG